MKVAHKEIEERNFSGHHAFGIFWEFNKKGDIKIDREGLYNVAYSMGFRINNGYIVRIEEIYLVNKTPGEFYDEIKSYINMQQPFERNEVYNAYESFIQKSGKFTIERLRNLEVENIIQDDEHTSYRFFKNLYLKITKSGVEEYLYSTVKGFIWKHKIIDRYWSDTYPEHFKYTEFLHYAVGLSNQLSKCIGYLVHDYKGENTGYIITLTEQCVDPKNGGGSGKNVFGNLLKLATSVHTVSGTQVQMNEKFLQSWNFQRVMFIADIPKRFDFMFLKEISTGTGTLKKLFKDEISVSAELMPKLMVNTNYSFEAADGGLKRRIIPIEFTDYFTKCGGVDAHFGCMFPNGWTEDDYIGFDHFINTCLINYFKADGKLKATELSDNGWVKQFEQNFGELTHNFISSNIESWLFSKNVAISDFNKQYEDFCRTNNIQKKFELSSIMMNRALDNYCERNKIEFIKSHTFKDDMDNTFKGKMFEKVTKLPT